MSIKMIPAIKVVTCDSCNKLCDDQNQTKEGLVIFTSRLQRGMTFDKILKRYDLCDDCFNHLMTTIETIFESLR